MAGPLERLPRWHQLFYLLAALNAITLTATLCLSHHTSRIFETSLRRYQHCTDRIGQCDVLSRLAAAANNAGSTVFTTRDVARERAEFERNLDSFSRQWTEVRSKIIAESPANVRRALDNLEEARLAMNRMATHARRIFEYLASDQDREAGQQVAAMELNLNATQLALARVRRHEQELERRHLVEQVEHVDNLRRCELALATCVAGGVLLVLGYSHLLARQFAARKQLEEKSQRRSEMLAHIAATQADFMAGASAMTLFDQLLRQSVEFTDSKCGFIAELLHAENGEPFLQCHATLLIGEEGAARPLPLPAGASRSGLATLFASVLESGKELILNASGNALAAGLPADYPILETVLALPLTRGDQLVGILALANHPQGYLPSIVDELRPLTATCAALMEAWRSNGLRQEVEDALRESHRELGMAHSRIERYATELESKNLQLEEERLRAEAANDAKSAFLANMSHEIRTPMTAILGYAELLLEDETNDHQPESRRQALQTIHRNGEHLLAVINDVLDLSKIEAGKMSTESIRCSPQQILTDVEALTRIRAEAKGLQLITATEGALPTAIQSDPTRLRQILVNLVTNAIKFTEEGSVRVTARWVKGETPLLAFDITDTGVGISAAEQARLFDSFSQADSSTTRRFGGTGLGLVISRHFAQLLGGDVRLVSSVPGVGSTFRVTIATGTTQECESWECESPQLDSGLSDSGLSESTPSSARPSGFVPRPLSGEAGQLTGCRILVAEDGLDNQRLIERVLQKAGADVTLVENGLLAVESAWGAVEQGQPFDIILMDMQMPVLDGYAAATRLRNEGYLSPIIALTAHAMSRDRDKCLAAGCDDFATKPLDRGRLLSIILRHFQRSNRCLAPANTESNMDWVSRPVNVFC